MIKFKALIQAIHQGIHSASKAVEAEGLKHIETFFDVIEPTTDEPITDANESSPATTTNVVTHRPKMVAMEFPSRTHDGIKTVTANIPLIALSPISSPRIKEVKFTTELEITSSKEGEELYVSFPPANRTGLFARGDAAASTSNAKLEITLTGHEPPEGLQKIIEGYERVLRAQIPG